MTTILRFEITDNMGSNVVATAEIDVSHIPNRNASQPRYLKVSTVYEGFPEPKYRNDSLIFQMIPLDPWVDVDDV